MALYEKMVAAWDKRDGQAYLDLHHDDFQMTFKRQSFKKRR